MRTVRVTLDDDLVKAVDKVSKRLGASRSEFTRRALRQALARYSVKQQERRHQEGYEERPVAADEFSAWESEHTWGDEGNRDSSAGTSSHRRTRNARFSS